MVYYYYNIKPRFVQGFREFPSFKYSFRNLLITHRGLLKSETLKRLERVGSSPQALHLLDIFFSFKSI